MRVEVVRDDLRPLYHLLDGLGVVVTQVSKPLDQAHAMILNSMRTRFRKQVNPDGKAWKKSKAAKIRESGGYTWSHGKKVTGGHTLFATGHLWHSLQAYSSKAKKDAHTRRVGTDAAEYKYHHYGSGEAQRIIVGVDKKDVAAFHKIVLRHIDQAVK